MRILLAALLVSAGALAGSRPRYGGEAEVLARGPLRTLDPAAAVTLAETLAARLALETLVTPDGSPALLAEEPQTIEGGKRVRLALRPGLTFQDQTPLTATHVAAAFERLLAQPSHAPYAPLVLPVAAVRAVNPAVVEVELRYPFPAFARLLSAPALAPARVRGAGPEQRWIGAGPFAAGARSAGGGLKLAAWSECPTGRPFLDAVQIAPVADPRAAAVQVERGEADAAVVSAAGRTTWLAASGKARERARIWAGALAALDPGELVRAFVRAPAEPGPAPAPAPGATPPAGVALRLMFDALEPDHRAVAERLQVKLRARGGDVRLVPLTYAELAERLGGGDWELAVFAPPRLPDPALELAALAVLLGDAARAHALLAAGAAPEAMRAGVQETFLLWPLYTETARRVAGKRFAALDLDAAGAPRLGEAWLLPAAR